MEMIIIGMVTYQMVCDSVMTFLSNAYVRTAKWKQEEHSFDFVKK